MGTFSAPVIFWGSLAVPLISLGTLLAMRFCRSIAGRALCQQAFLLQLLILGLLTLAALSTGSDAWVASGAIFSVITLCATCDLGGERRRATTF
jgi:hypothetical protein